MKFKRLIKLSGVSGGILLLILLLTPISSYFYLPLTHSDEPVRGDYLIILSASGYENGAVDYRTMSRMYKGLRLFRDGYGEQFICLGQVIYGAEGQFAIVAQMRELLILSGVDPTAITLLDHGGDTYHDLMSLLVEHDEIDFNKVNFITSAYHTFRVRKILRKKGILSPVVAASDWELYPRKWTERVDLCRELFREWSAILYSKIKGWI